MSEAFDLTTYYAKRIIGDTAASDAENALLQTGVGIAGDTWILHRDDRTSKKYGIKYAYDSSGNDKIEYYGKNANDNATAWIQLNTGDASFYDFYGNSAEIKNNITVTSKGRGLYLTDGASKQYAGIYDNASNLWIGATSATGQHHKGNTYISAGHNGTTGNKSIYISIPADGNASTTHTSYALVYKDATGNSTTPIYVNADGKTVACNDYTTLFTKLSWTAGTTDGPTLDVTIGGTNKTATIPSASATASGIVTNTAQTFGGIKTFYRESTTANNYAAGIAFTNKDTTTGQTQDTAYIRAYNTHAANNDGMNMVIRSCGNMFIGGGESPGSLYATLTTSTTEHLFCTADNTVYIEANANTIANRIGIAIDTSGAIVPVKAEAANNNKQNIGASDNKFANIYATTFIGALNGNADSATQVKVTGVSLPSSGNVIYYLTYAGSTTTGNQDIKDCARLYLFENTTASYLNIGSASTSGGITVHNANGKYSDIVSSAFSANRVVTLPDQTGTIALLTKTDINALINLLDTGTSVLTADDYIITQYVGGGTTTTTYHRRAAKNVRVGGLTTARSLWGNDFDGTAAINGHIKLGSSKHIYMNYNSTDYAILYNHNNGNVSLRAAGAGLYIAYADTTFVNWMNGRMELRDGCLSLFPNNTSYREGLRIHATSSWSDITLCGNDNTGNSGTSANSWLIGNNNGNFYITRNGSSSGTAWLGCVGNVWKVYGNQSNSKSKQQSILHIYGGTCGNTAADMISGTAGLFSWGDGGPQITFDTNATPGGGQAGALIFTDNDTAAAGVSWHFVSNQTDWNVISKRFHARTSISIGTDLPSTSYNLSVTGTSYFSSTTTLGGDLLFSNSATTTRQIRGVVGDNDYWRIAGGATAANAGWMEIATADDGNEPIYVRQYTGAYTTITRTATLLDANGNSSFPGNITCIGAPQTVTAANMAFNGGVQLREVGAVGNAQSAIEYGPRLSFHWSNRVAKSITLHSDGKFYFRDQNGTTRSTIDANLTGTADVASKLGTATVGGANRPIYLNAGTATAVSWYHNSCTISGGNQANYPWHRFAYCATGTGNYTDKSVIVILHGRFDGGQYGMVKLSMRTNSAGAAKSTSAVWIYRKGFAVDDIKISAPTKTTGTDETISAYIKCGTYPRRIAYILEGSNLGWALVSSNEPSDTTASDKKGGTEINASVSGNNATDGTTVSYANSAGSASSATTATNVAWTGITSNPGIYTNDVSGSSYGNVKITTAKGGYYGFLIGTSTSCMNVMSSGQHNGLYCQAKGRWMFYYDSTNDRCGIGTSSTTANYILTVGGDTYINGNLKGNNTKTIGTTAIADHWNKLYLGGSTTGSNAINSANPLIEFSDADRSQYGQLIYTDYDSVRSPDGLTWVGNQANSWFQAPRVFGAVWNDYAEYRETKEDIQPGRCVVETGNGDLVLSTKRLQGGCEIVSDTFGFAIGQTNTCKTPTACAGRVLAYLYEDNSLAKPGDPVCSGPNGTVSLMTHEEEIEWPSRIIATVSEIPTYDEWEYGSADEFGVKEKLKVNGRIWIRIR